MATDYENILDQLIRQDDGCWIWPGGQTSNGYGKRGGRLVHRLIYEHLVGPIPDGLTLDHLCRVRLCANPEHLEPVTNQENVLRNTGPTALNAQKTHCPENHEYTPENTYVTKIGGRRCRACNRAQVAAYKARRAAAC